MYEDEIDSLSHTIDVSFTGTIHCNQETCDVMRKELHFRKNKQPSEAVYGTRSVMDIDGNAFTERFYRLIMSKGKQPHFLLDLFLVLSSSHRCPRHRNLFMIQSNAICDYGNVSSPNPGTVFKMAMFQERHDDRLIPWVHYVPISLKMTELPGTLRFLGETERGQEIAKNVAEQGSDWAVQVLRQDDLGFAVF